MIAQILAPRGRGGVADGAAPRGEELSRAAHAGVRGVQIALAVVLLPALATMLIVGGVGAAAAGLWGAFAGDESRSRRPGEDETGR